MDFYSQARGVEVGVSSAALKQHKFSQEGARQKKQQKERKKKKKKKKTKAEQTAAMPGRHVNWQQHMVQMKCKNSEVGKSTMCYT